MHIAGIVDNSLGGRFIMQDTGWKHWDGCDGCGHVINADSKSGAQGPSKWYGTLPEGPANMFHNVGETYTRKGSSKALETVELETFERGITGHPTSHPEDAWDADDPRIVRAPFIRPSASGDVHVVHAAGMLH